MITKLVSFNKKKKTFCNELEITYQYKDSKGAGIFMKKAT
jgi:hypothetical protein